MRTTSTRTDRRGIMLSDGVREFLRHPSPWMLGAVLVVSLAVRILVGGWQPTDAWIPLAMLAVFPFFEWIVHVFVLHWRPRRLGRLTIDPLLARKHREHHVNPRDVPLIFIPWRTLLWALPVAVAIALFAFPRLGLGLTFLVFVAALGLVYEWCHYLIHSGYKPKSQLFRSVWMNHRQHHYRNEHYWFTVTTSGTADRVLGTCPDPASVAASRTAKNLHALTPAR